VIVMRLREGETVSTLERVIDSGNEVEGAGPVESGEPAPESAV